MKLKPVVASLVLLGLSAPGFAHSAKTMTLQQGVVNQNSIISTVCSDGWLNRITLGGRGSVVAIMGNHDLPGSFTRVGPGSDIYVNDVNLIANADLSKWSKVTLNLGYVGAPNQWTMTGYHAELGSIQAVPYVTDHRMFVDEAYVTLADLSRYPFYAKIGKLYVPFGEYNDQHIPWQIQSPVQMVTETNAPAAVLGLASDFGLYASLFVIKGDSRPHGGVRNSVRNWGGKIGYQDNLARFEAPNTRMNINLGYMRNVWDSIFLSPNTDFRGMPWSRDVSSTNVNDYPRDESSAVAAHMDIAYKAFSAYADYVGILKDLHKDYYSGSAPGTKHDNYSGSSRFWGFNVNAAYAFETLSHDSSFEVGLQMTGNGQWFATNKVGKHMSNGNNDPLFSMIIPKWRALGEYTVNLCKHTDLSLIYAHSKSYDLDPYNTDGKEMNAARHTNLGLARLAFRF